MRKVSPIERDLMRHMADLGFTTKEIAAVTGRCTTTITTQCPTRYRGFGRVRESDLSIQEQEDKISAE